MLKFIIIFCINVFLWLIGIFRVGKIHRLLNKDICTDDYKISVIIPCRNEAKKISRLLLSLIKQNKKIYEIIVVNDNSSDDTSEIAKSFGVKVIDLVNVPEKWIGKNWACWNGFLASSGDILLFLDSDVWVNKDFIQSLLSFYKEKNGIISVQPFHFVKKWYEHFSLFFNVISMLSINSFNLIERYNRPTGLFGPCIMCSREDYVKVGGHYSVRSEVVEDMALGKLFASKDIPITCLAGGEIASFRMYENGIRSLIEGWSKNFITGAFKLDLINMITVISWVYGTFNCLFMLIEQILTVNISTISFALVLYGLYVIQIYWIVKKISNYGFLSSLLFPIYQIGFLLIFIKSIVNKLFFRKVRWKGRKISI